MPQLSHLKHKNIRKNPPIRYILHSVNKHILTIQNTRGFVIKGLAQLMEQPLPHRLC